jgi:hypothetical protein
VGVARIELATPAMSTQCSTTELHAHPVGARHLGAGCEARKRITADWGSGSPILLEGCPPRRGKTLREEVAMPLRDGNLRTIVEQ